MKVTIRDRIDVDFSGTVAELLAKLDINPVTVVVTKEGDVLLNTDYLENKDEVRILIVGSDAV